MDYARTIGAVGLFTSGLAAGLTLSYPVLVNAHFASDKSGYPIKYRLAIWNDAYDWGKGAIPACAVTTAAFFLAQSFLFPIAGVSQKSAILASLLHVSIAPFTIVFIKPVNDILIGMRKRANEEGTVTTYTENDVKPLFAKWIALHNVRVAVTCTAFGVAIANWLGLYSL